MMKKSASTKDGRGKFEYSEEFFQVYFLSSKVGWYRADLDKPLSIRVPIDKQAEHLIKYAFLADCNESFVSMYGYEKKEELLGARFPQLFNRSDERNVHGLLQFVQQGYWIEDAESHEMDRQGKSRFFTNSIIGIVRNGFLVRIWGRQWDVTARKSTEAKNMLILDRLTNRQRLILHLSVDGLELKEIAAKIGISPKTVSTLRIRLMKKLNAGSLASLVKIAVQKNLV